MTAPKNNPEILALSETAQAILAGHWMMGKDFTLTMNNQKSRLTHLAAGAMDELVAAGIISDTKTDDGYPESRTYKLTDRGAAMEFRKSFSWMECHGTFSITEPIT